MTYFPHKFHKERVSIYPLPAISPNPFVAKLILRKCDYANLRFSSDTEVLLCITSVRIVVS